MAAYPCPACGGDTKYQVFSGGREWYCPGCGADGSYPAEGDNLPRATLLRNGEAGATALRAQMDQELARRREDPEFLARIKARVEADREILNRLEGPDDG